MTTDHDGFIDVAFSAKTVGPEARRKLKGLLDYYAKKPKPFTACVRDNRKRFGPLTEKYCAVLKDLIVGNTHWRKGGPKKKAFEETGALSLTDATAFLACLDLLPDGDAELGAALREMEDKPLETVDLEGVEIFSSGGPYHGTGSKPEGDEFSAEEIDEIVAANVALADEVFPINKCGHSKEQALAFNSGLIVTPGERPALGWLTNFRAVDRKGKRKIVVDVKKVPKKFGKLILAGAYPKRSCELSTVESQTLGRTFDRVVTGLAWLGEKAPAVRTLDEVIALFVEDDDVEGVEFGEGDIVWAPEEGFEAIRRHVQAALNEAYPGQGQIAGSYWVRDVAQHSALVEENGGDVGCYVVGLIRTGSSVTLAPRSDWVEAEQAWVQATAAYADEHREAEMTRGETETGKPADTSGVSKPLTDEQIVALAATFSIDEADDAKRRELVLAALSEHAPPEAGAGDGGDGDGDGDGGAGEGSGDGAAGAGGEGTQKDDSPTGVQMSEADLEVLKTKADRGQQVYEERRVERREATLNQAIRVGKFLPEKRQFWSDEYDHDADRTLLHLAELPENEDWARIYGSDDDGMSPESTIAAEDAYYEEYAARTGIKRQEVTV